MRLLSLVAVLFLLAASAFASAEGECAGGLCGFDCENMCPLAHQANAWRAVGDEALTVASKVHADHVALVVKNLGKI